LRKEKLGYCQKCGAENREGAKFCRGCGCALKEEVKPEAAKPVTTAPAGKPSKAWYLAPIFGAWLGGIITYFALRDKDKGMAKNCLWLGIATTVFYMLTQFMFLSLAYY